MPSMNRKQFFSKFLYEVEKDFDVNGTPASWAKTDSQPAHRFWGDEDDKIEYPYTEEEYPSSSSFAISADEKFVAVSGGLIISIFHTESKDCRTEFRGLTQASPSLTFNRLTDEEGGYQLIIGTGGPPGGGKELLFLDLDSEGRMLNEQKTLPVTNLVNQSLELVSAEARRTFDLPATSPLLASVRDDYVKILEKLQAKLLASNLCRIEGQVSGFDSRRFSKDGKLFVYLTHNKTTQQGMRPPEELPHIVIYDVENRITKFSIPGHEDAIMWTAFSPDDKHVASACWDGTFRIFNTETGSCEHIIGPTGGQCWSGAWSPDSKHVLFCGMGRRESDDGTPKGFTLVAVFSVETGEEVARFEHDSLKHWVRNVDWSSRGEIAIVHETEIWIWKPFQNEIVTSFSLRIEDRMMRSFAGFGNVVWDHDGRLLFFESGDGTIEVWERDENVKWRLQRPFGVAPFRYARSLHWLAKERTMMSLDGDGFIRFYNLN